jgi:polysaccharide biosynthesis transport protein
MDNQIPQHPYQNVGNNQIVPSTGAAGAPDIYRQGGSAYPNYGYQESIEVEEKGFDVLKYLRIANKYRWLIAGIVLTTMLLATTITFLMQPIYRATVSIQIDRESMNIVKLDGVQPEEGGSGLDFYQTQYELLASRSLGERVVTTLGLVTDTSFNEANVGLIATIKQMIGGQNNEATALAEELSQEELTRKSVDKLARSLSIAPVRGSRIVKVSIDHTRPSTAQKLANGYSEIFIADNLDRRFDATSYARKFLEERLLQLKGKLEDSERILVKYAEEQGIIRLEDNKNLLTSDLEATNKRLADVRADRIKKELLWKQAQSAAGLGLKEILDSDAVKSNRKLRTELAAEYQQKLAVFKPAFPDMVKLRNQIRELDRQIQNEIGSIKSSIEALYLAAKEEEDQLVAQLEITKGDVVDQRNRSIEYNILQREVDTNRSLYDGLLQRYKEIGIAGGVGTNNITIVDKAALPLLPRSPNLLLNLVLALIGGLILGVLSALFLDFLDDTFKSPEDVEQNLGFPVIGIVPLPKPGITIEEELMDARSGMAEAYRSLRTGLQFATSEGLPKTLLVTSSKPSEGKTTTTISLARSIASLGLQVLLIDGDLRNASVHKRLLCSNSVGLSNYLSGAKMPEEVVQTTDTHGLILISSGPLPPNPAELLSGPRLASLLALASQSFDIVLIDGPPVMGLADAPLLSTMTQSTLLVVAANETRRSAVKLALRRLQFARANLVGVLLNKFNAKEAGYGYGYGDYEYHSYGTENIQITSANT